jgi:hypothetical protein
VVGGLAFNADVDTIVALDEAFLQTAAETLFEGFSLFLTEVTLTVAQVEVDSLAGCASNPVLSVDTNVPRVEIVPNAPWSCTSDVDCQETNALSSGTCCTGAGAPNATCVAADECDPATVPTNVTGGIALNQFPQVAFSCTADAAPGTLAVCTSGNRAPAVAPLATPSETYVRVNVGSLNNVSFDCEPGTPQNPNVCDLTSECPATTICFMRECTGPAAFTLPYDPTGDVCASQDANAGVACTSNADCDAACDPVTQLCGDSITPCTDPNNPDDACAGAGGGTCAPACPQFDIL